VQSGKQRDRRLADVPTIHELMDQYKANDAGRRLANLVLAGGEFGRPYVLPPNTPPDRVKMIREAFAKTLQDEAAIADGKQKNLEFDPSTAAELETLAKEVVTQPPEIVARVKKLLTK